MSVEKRKPFYERWFQRLEPALQHDGFAYTITIVFLLLNLIVFFVGAAPAWKKTATEGVAFRLASAVARGGGAMLDLDSALVILVASRSLMTYLRRTPLNMIVPFDKAMPAFHSFVGNSLVVGMILHVLGHIVRYSLKHLFDGGFIGPTSLFISGILLTLILGSMKITALLVLRRKSFETFYWVHNIGFVLYFVLIIMHGSHIGILKTWMYVSGPLVIYFVDRLVRLLKEKGSTVTITRKDAVLKGSDMVCLRIPRAFSYLAGQYCDIKVPLVSNLQWHPFTIASSPHEGEMLFYIKVNGDWTRKLHTLFKELDGDHDPISVHVRGPYGAPAQHCGQYEHVVLISGGVGATPFCSITKYAHHWILNYTRHGAEKSNTVSAAFTRNQSVRGTPSVPGTPTLQNSGYNSAVQRSANPSRHMSRNHSGNNFARNLSGGKGGNFARNHSGNNFARNHSGNNFARNHSGNNFARNHSGGNFVRSLSRPLSRNASRNGSRAMSRSGSGQLERFNSAQFDRTASGKTNDSIGIIIQEQRQNQPDGPASFGPASFGPASFGPASYRGQSPLAADIPFRPPNVALSIPGMESSGDNAALRQYLDDFETENLPPDYDEALGNPEAPIPDRRATPIDAHGTPQHQSYEEVKEYDSSQELFEDDDEDDGPPSRTDHMRVDVLGNGMLDDSLAIDIEAGDAAMEEYLLCDEQGQASNGIDLLGMSFGPNAMRRHLNARDGKKMRSSMVRASMNLMEDAMDSALWQDRILFYLHSVTVNWTLLWIMMIRFGMVGIAAVMDRFFLSQQGLGIFSGLFFNICDMILAVLISIPLAGAVVFEIWTHGLSEYLADNVGNSFDLFLLLPLLVGCVVLHILDFANVGTNIRHVSKLTVFLIWPLLSLLLFWRIIRTIGSRVKLAQYSKSSHAQTKSLDYIWVGKTAEDDAWLIQELLPLAEDSIVRLHRFITRHGPKTEPWMLDYERIPLKTTYDRPNWDDVFSSLVERSKSGTVIGVFFCGPDNMARMIQQAAMKAMQQSLKNAYERGWAQKRGGGYGNREEEMGFAQSGVTEQGRLGRMTSKVTEALGRGSARPMQGPSSPPTDDRDPAMYGCGVRIAVRIENFT